MSKRKKVQCILSIPPRMIIFGIACIAHDVASQMVNHHYQITTRFFGFLWHLACNKFTMQDPRKTICSVNPRLPMLPSASPWEILTVSGPQLKHTVFLDAIKFILLHNLINEFYYSSYVVTAYLLIRDLLTDNAVRAWGM